MIVLKALLSFFIILTFTSCGYSPSSKFARVAMGEKISTAIVISLVDPENTVLVKDAVDSAIVEVFHASLTSQTYSDSHLIISISDPAYVPTVYDRDGFITGYRMSVNLKIVRHHKGISKIYNTVGTYDFTVLPNAVITDQERFNAIKNGAKKAILLFVAQVSAEGARAKKIKQ